MQHLPALEASISTLARELQVQGRWYRPRAMRAVEQVNALWPGKLAGGAVPHIDLDLSDIKDLWPKYKSQLNLRQAEVLKSSR